MCYLRDNNETQKYIYFKHGNHLVILELKNQESPKGHEQLSNIKAFILHYI